MHAMLIVLAVLFAGSDTAISVRLGSKENLADGKATGKAIEQGSYFFLGANGELIAPSKIEEQPCLANLRFPYTEESQGMLLWLPIVLKPFVEIASDGTITLPERLISVETPIASPGYLRRKDIHLSPGLLPELPTRWPFMQDGRPVPAPRGAILCRSLEKKTPPAVPPENATGWLLLGWDGALIAPVLGAPMPANPLWVVDGGANRGIDLVFGGPLHSGVYAHVSPDGEMRYGEKRLVALPLSAIGRQLSMIAPNSEANDIKSYWPFFKDMERTRLALMPPGYAIQPFGISLKEITVTVDEAGKVDVHLRPKTVY
jgi:hypothetical protein